MLNHVARAAVAELEALGIRDLTGDEYVELNDLGRAQLDAGRELREAFLAHPVRLGNEVLRPLTCAGADFLVRVAQACSSSSGGGEVTTWAFAYALARGHEPGAFDGLVTAADVARAVEAWRKGLCATQREVVEACNEVSKLEDAALCEDARTAWDVARNFLESDPDVGEDVADAAAVVEGALHAAILRRTPAAPAASGGEVPSWRTTCNTLAVATGTDAEYWMHRPLAETLKAFETAMKFAAARAAFGAGFDDGARAPDEAVLRAIRAVRDCMRRIVGRRRRCGNGGGE